VAPPHLPPCPLPLPRCGRGRGEDGAGAILRQSTIPRSPTSPLPRCGRGAGGVGRPHLPPCPLPLPPATRKGERGVTGERLAPPHAMVAQARYVPNKNFGFLIKLLVVQASGSRCAMCNWNPSSAYPPQARAEGWNPSLAPTLLSVATVGQDQER
jgi:hypothetical protein